MNRRTFLKSLSAATIATPTNALPAFGSVPKIKVTGLPAAQSYPLFNQSDLVVTIETG